MQTCMSPRFTVITEMSASQANRTMNVPSSNHHRPHISIKENVRHIPECVMCDQEAVRRRQRSRSVLHDH